MGGRALLEKGITPRRVDAAEYNEISESVLEQVEELLPNSEPWRVESYHGKETFGDIDVLLISDELPSTWKDDLVRHFRPLAWVSNGSVLSMEFRGMQADFIPQAASHYDFSKRYFAWNDLGNFIGRIARACGFKFGHDGLKYMLRAPEDFDRVIQEITVTTDFNKAMDFLGFDWVRHRKGFDTLEDIYFYVVANRFYRFHSFDLQERSRKARVRDQKRPVYQDFMTWLRANDFDFDDSDTMPNKDAELRRALDDFPDFRDKYYYHLRQHDMFRRFGQIFNGHIVASKTGLEGKELGIVMKIIIETNGGKENMRDHYLNIPADAVDQQIDHDIENARRLLEWS